MIFRILQYLPVTMSLYGDYANAAALSRMITAEGGQVELVRSETYPDGEFDAMFIGSGTEKNSFYALDALARDRGRIEEQLGNGIVFATGNSWELFGKTIDDAVLGKREGLGFFDFSVKRDYSVRIVTDVISDFAPTGEKSAGFINGCSAVSRTAAPMFINCLCADHERESDGIISGGFYGTSFTGPVLIRNPHILRWIADGIYERKGFVPENRSADEIQSKALAVTLRELEKRLKNSKKS